jgi:hypothetical protein
MNDHLGKVEQHPNCTQYLCKINESDQEELIAFYENLSFLKA